MNKETIIFIIILGVMFAVSIPVISQSREANDFIAYWSSAYLLVNGGNPYSQDQIAEIQEETIPSRSNNDNITYLAWNPPWLLIILIPFGYLPYSMAFQIWIFISTLLISISIYYVWISIYKNINHRDFLATIFLGFTFGPTLSLLVLGQVTVIILICVILSIYYMPKRKDFLIGILILFTLIKPHISYFFVIYMFLIIFLERRWKILLGILSMLLLSVVIMWLLLPDWIIDYVGLLNSLPYSTVYTSTFGNLFYVITGHNFFQFFGIVLLPIFIVIAYKLFNQNLLSAINFGILISIPFSPFGFLFDQVIAIPSLIQIYDWGIMKQFNSYRSKIILVTYIGINLLILLLMIGRNAPYYLFSWVPITLLILYLYSYKTKNERSKTIP